MEELGEGSQAGQGAKQGKHSGICSQGARPNPCQVGRSQVANSISFRLQQAGGVQVDQTYKPGTERRGHHHWAPQVPTVAINKGTVFSIHPYTISEPERQKKNLIN